MSQLENNEEVEINMQKYIYASASQIEGCYYRNGPDKIEQAAIEDGWTTYVDFLGFTRFKRVRKTWNGNH